MLTTWKLLQGMLDKLIRQLSPPKSVDPFSVLPIELVEMIISYLTFRNMVLVSLLFPSHQSALTSRPLSALAFACPSNGKSFSSTGLAYG
jgi:F-box/TPR repeat protein Pof3